MTDREQTRRAIVDTLELYGFHASARMAREEFDALLTELEQAERERAALIMQVKRLLHDVEHGETTLARSFAETHALVDSQ